MNTDYILRKNGLYFFGIFLNCETIKELDKVNEREHNLIKRELQSKNADWFAVRVKLERAYEKRKNELLS